MQAKALISRLTDEKNNALQQHNKLRQELVGSKIQLCTCGFYLVVRRIRLLESAICSFYQFVFCRLSLLVYHITLA